MPGRCPGLVSGDGFLVSTSPDRIGIFCHCIEHRLVRIGFTLSDTGSNQADRWPVSGFACLTGLPIICRRHDQAVLAAGHCQVDIGQQFGIEQCAM